MKAVFADTSYWIAIFRPGDSWSAAARKARAQLGAVRLITVDEVLVEFLAALSSAGPLIREQAVAFVRTMLAHPQVEVIPQSRQTFLDGLSFYANRLDKNYSLTDCVAMRTMKRVSVAEALTSDRHFEQEGFRILMRR